MKKYANIIALITSTLASGTLLYFAWPILISPDLNKFAWMIIAIIAMVFIAYYQLLNYILKEIL